MNSAPCCSPDNPNITAHDARVFCKPKEGARRFGNFSRRGGGDDSRMFVFATKHRRCAMTGTSPFRDSATRITRKLANSPSLEREGIQACHQATEMSVLFLMLGIHAVFPRIIGWQTNDRTIDCVASLASFRPNLACVAAPTDKISDAYDLGRKMSSMIEGCNAGQP